MILRDRKTGEIYIAWKVIDLDNNSKIPDWIFDAFVVKDIVHSSHNASLYVNTIRGTMIAKIGDFIIKGVEGELYPVRKNIFEKTYEVVE